MSTSNTAPIRALRANFLRRPGPAVLSATLLTIALVGSGCGSSAKSQPGATSTGTPVHGTLSGRSEHTARTRPTPTPPAELTRFESRVALAAGTFHRYVYTPFKTRDLQNKAAMTKAGGAAAASFEDVLQAKQSATGGTAVRSLFASLASLSATLNQIGIRLHAGHADPPDIESANAAIAGLERDAAAANVKITERMPASFPATAPGYRGGSEH